jgi:hypothetical protein
VNGPKPPLVSGSLEKLTTVVVRPWKLSSATTIVASPSGTPFTSWPHLRAILIAVSTASAPVFIGSTVSSRGSRVPASAASAAQNGSSWSWRKARLVSVTRSSSRRAASTSTGWRWPKFKAEYAARKSR